MIDLNSAETAAKLLHFADIMAESQYGEEFGHVLDVVIALREKISDLEWELKQRPRAEEYRKLYKEKEQWRAGALKIKKQLELEKGQNEQLKQGALNLAENLMQERQEREAAQRTIARLGGQVEDERSQRVAAEGMVEFFAGEEI